jgi:hypothetical protein
MNPIINSNTLYSHTHSRDSILVWIFEIGISYTYTVNRYLLFVRVIRGRWGLNFGLDVWVWKGVSEKQEM